MIEAEYEIDAQQSHQAESQTVAAEQNTNPGMETIMNINVTLSIQVGKTKMKLKDLMKLNKGTVIELNKMAGEPLDILINDEQIARGEVVVVNGNYGIRITEVSKNAYNTAQR